jgi:lysozyme
MQKTRFLLVMVCVGICACYIGYRYFIMRQPILYPDFGIEIPAGYTTHGIDISHYQKIIDWELVAKMRDRGQRISFAIAKATEGTRKIDKHFARNWKAMKEHQLHRGAYLYFHPARNGKTQAEHYLAQVALERGDFKPIIDIEETNGLSKEKVRQQLKECADILEKKFKCKPILYSNVDFYDHILGSDFDEYPFWGAHYETKQAPRTSRTWQIWQHNCKGHVNGIDAYVDFNVLNEMECSLDDLCL